MLALAQSRKIDAVLVCELTRWGRSTIDLISTLQDLNSWNVSLIAQSGIQFDLSTSQGRLIANLMASLAEFERDLIRERVKSGIAVAMSKGKKFGRTSGDNYKIKRYASKVLKLRSEGMSFQRIADSVGLSKTSVVKIVKLYTVVNKT